MKRWIKILIARQLTPEIGGTTTMLALKSTYLIILILIAAGYASGQSCQLRVLTQTERGQLIDVDGLAVKSVATGEAKQADSRIGTGVYSFSGIATGYYIIAAAKTGFKRTIHNEYVRCSQFSFTAATVPLYEGPANETIETRAPAPNDRTPSVPPPVSRSPFEVEPAKPSQNEPQLPNEDLGVDIGVVISDRANLREGPSTTNPAIRELQRGELFVLLSRVPLGPWYRVIHVKSGLEGWINGNTIRVRYTEKPKPPPVFQERETGSYENPDIEITNDSHKTLYLRVGDDDRIVIAAHSTQTITKPAGTYWFYAVCPGVLPAFGERSFKIGSIYTWRFYIVTTY
jgi:hypothetical protein